VRRAAAPAPAGLSLLRFELEIAARRHASHVVWEGMMARVLVTGVAGFVGFHLAQRLLTEGQEVVGVDSLNDYYSVQLKRDRLKVLCDRGGAFSFEQLDLADRERVAQLFAEVGCATVLHMAAQAGVRYSLTHPHAYVDSNLTAFVNVLEGCRRHGVQHLVYASSSSVYGANRKVPFAVGDPVDTPISLYAATKKANELMAYTYSHLYSLPTTGLRFFTVYGPWGRPDMAMYKFTEAIAAGRPIDVYNYGKMRRDFTYIDDIVEGVLRTAERPPVAEEGPAYRLYNIGNHRPEELETLIALIEEALGKTAVRNYLPLQPGDVLETYADIEDLRQDVGFAPSTPLKDGVARFVAWFQGYHGV
jgi:UDP-glucuronate 4-epimerase